MDLGLELLDLGVDLLQLLAQGLALLARRRRRGGQRREGRARAAPGDTEHAGSIDEEQPIPGLRVEQRPGVARELGPKGSGAARGQPRCSLGIRGRDQVLAGHVDVELVRAPHRHEQAAARGPIHGQGGERRMRGQAIKDLARPGVVAEAGDHAHADHVLVRASGRDERAIRDDGERHLAVEQRQDVLVEIYGQRAQGLARGLQVGAVHAPQELDQLEHGLRLAVAAQGQDRHLVERAQDGQGSRAVPQEPRGQGAGPGLHGHAHAQSRAVDAQAQAHPTDRREQLAEDLAAARGRALALLHPHLSVGQLLAQARHGLGIAAGLGAGELGLDGAEHLLEGALRVLLVAIGLAAGALGQLVHRDVAGDLGAELQALHGRDERRLRGQRALARDRGQGRGQRLAILGTIEHQQEEEAVAQHDPDLGLAGREEDRGLAHGARLERAHAGHHDAIEERLQPGAVADAREDRRGGLVAAEERDAEGAARVEADIVQVVGIQHVGAGHGRCHGRELGVELAVALDDLGPAELGRDRARAGAGDHEPGVRGQHGHGRGLDQHGDFATVGGRCRRGRRALRAATRAEEHGQQQAERAQRGTGPQRALHRLHGYHAAGARPSRRRAQGCQAGERRPRAEGPHWVTTSRGEARRVNIRWRPGRTGGFVPRSGPWLRDRCVSLRPRAMVAAPSASARRPWGRAPRARA